MTAEITAIPEASALQQQLDLLNLAILSLNAGMPVTNLTVQQDMNQPPPANAGPAMLGPYRVTLNPPITNPVTLQSLSTELQAQADSITQQLVGMGYAEPPPPAWRK
jgi:hypothetical protein